MLDTVIVHKIPEAVRVGTAVALEQHRIGRAREGASRQATREAGHRLNTIVERASGAARTATSRSDRGKDSMRQII